MAGFLLTWRFPITRGYHLGGAPQSKDYDILGSPYFGRLPLRVFGFRGLGFRVLADLGCAVLCKQAANTVDLRMMRCLATNV